MGRYELGRHIARGGMGDVFEAQDQQLQRRVAVKVFRGAIPSDRARFRAEAVTLAAFNHPGLVQVYDAGEFEGDAFVVLELVDGPTLETTLVDNGARSRGDVAALGAQVADALSYVHERGVVHRDVTPSNILCGPDGRPRLVDFGIARLVDTTRLTAPATALGTALYMAPEQVLGEDVTPAADVYALGLVLLEMLTCRKPFVGSAQEVAVARLVRRPSVPSDLPEAWRCLIQEMTDPDASVRPSAAEVRDRLESMSVQLGSTDAFVVTPATHDEPTRATVLPSHDVNPTASRADATAMMPTDLISDDEPEHRRAPWAILAAILGLVLVVGIGMALAQDGEDVETPPTTTVAEPAVTAATTPATDPPAQQDRDGAGGDGEGEGGGNGKGQEKGKDKDKGKP